MDLRYSPVLVGLAYTAFREKYYANYHSTNFNPEKFTNLALVMEKEQIDYQKYFDFVFGILDYKTPPTPAGLINPELIEKFRAMHRD